MAEPVSHNRRNLFFESVEDVIRDVNLINRAAEKNQLSPCGQWTPGEILTHLSAWIEYAYEGYPIDAPPWFIRQYLKFAFRAILKNGMQPGVNIPGIEGGTIGQEKFDTDTACKRYLVALNRLNSREPAKYHNPAFGKMSPEKRVKLNLRHAELHLSFLQYPR